MLVYIHVNRYQKIIHYPALGKGRIYSEVLQHKSAAALGVLYTGTSLGPGNWVRVSWYAYNRAPNVIAFEYIDVCWQYSFHFLSFPVCSGLLKDIDNVEPLLP